MKRLPKNLSKFGLLNEEINQKWDRKRLAEIRDFVSKNLKPTKNINRSVNSYTVKHAVEAEIGMYISNGELIAAMIQCGFEYIRQDTSPNCYFNISVKSLQQ